MRNRRYCWLTAGACTAYLLLEVLYVLRLPLIMDEFEGASAAFRLGRELPYRDFSPYKTVLGYYLQFVPLHVAGGGWPGLMTVKLWLAVLNAAVLAWAAVRMGRLFRRDAVLLALLLLIVMSTFLERSAELRVDMLTGWAGLASLVLILERRPASAGALAGLSFLVSQKGIYYVLAGAAALGVCWLAERRTRRALADVAGFLLATGMVVLLYVGLWSAVSSMSAVLNATFVAPQAVALRQVYAIQGTFWFQTVSRNPFFYIRGLLGLLMLALAWRAGRPRYADRVLLPYGLVLLGLGVLHRQPWPYFFVLLIPTLFALTAAGFDLGLDRREQAGNARMPRPELALYILFGMLWPLSRVPVNLGRDNSFQRHMITLAESFLGPKDTYLAGVDLLYDRNRQPVGWLQWVDRPRLLRLQALGEAEVHAIIDSLDASPTKLLVDNYRLAALPDPIRAYLHANYERLWGNLSIYAPEVPSGSNCFALKFGGDYLLEGQGTAVIDQEGWESGGTRFLASGPHCAAATTKLRLKLQPERWHSRVSPAFEAPRSFFPGVYTY